MSQMLRRFNIFALAVALAGCGGTALPSEAGPTSTVAETSTTAPPPTTTTTTEPADYYDGLGFLSLAEEDLALAAKARGKLDVFTAPDSDMLVTLPETTILGTVTVVAVVGIPEEDWIEVRLPIRPNGTTGWVRAADVDLFVVEGRIVVDVSEKTLTYLSAGREVLSSTVAVGTGRNPTPTGHFYVTDNVTLADPTSPWGPHALGLSGRSDTITEYNGGDGIIGIHGTNRPGSIGKAASLGCVRLPNEVITQLHELIAVGTPVEIRA
jgi:hypothetical protein